MRASHSSSKPGGRACNDGNEPTTPALHCAITRSGTEMMKSGEPITGIDRRPLNRAGMDIARRSFVGKQIEGWAAIPTRQSFQCQVLRLGADADVVTAIPTCGIPPT